MRDDRVTIAKAIGILLMVVAHGGAPDWMAHFIWMFHMPLFFFVSGYCFKEKYLSCSPLVFIKKRVKSLYFPFVKWSLLFLLLHNVFYHLNIYNNEYGFNGEVSYLYGLKDYVTRVIKIVVGLHGQEQLLGGYWFLPQLLYASVIGLFMIKYIKNLWGGAVVLLVLTLLTSYFNLRVPFWGIRSLTFLSATFFLLGFLYKKKFDNWNRWFLTICFFILVIIGSVFCCTSMLRFTAIEILPYVVFAICGTVMTLNISSFISKRENTFKKILMFIGDNTMAVLTWHFLCFKIVSLIIIGVYGLPIEQLAYFPVIPEFRSWWVVYLIVGAGVPLIVKRYIISTR